MKDGRRYDVNPTNDEAQESWIYMQQLSVRDSHKGIIIGKGGSMLKKIGSQARSEIENLLDCQVNLQLWVKVKRTGDSDFLLKNYGYNNHKNTNGIF